MMSPKKQKKSCQKKNQSNLNKNFDMYVNKVRDEQNTRLHDMHTLGALLNEYMDSYIVIGYDLTGTAVKLTHADTAKDEDALSSLMSEFITNKMINPEDEN